MASRDESGDSQGTGLSCDRDRSVFLAMLAQIERRFGAEVHAYVLMGNHFHVLVRSRDGQLSRAMHWLGTSYAKYFNSMNERVGVFFRGRYQSRLVEDERYRAWVWAYIHLNPVNDGFVSDPGDWRWSSHRAYTGATKEPAWLHTGTLRASLSGADYNGFVCSYMSISEREATREPQVVAENWALERGDEFDLGSVERRVAEEFKVAIDDLCDSTTGSQNLPRLAAVALSSLHTSRSQDEIAAHYGLSSRSAVAAAVSRLGSAMEPQPAVARRLVRSGLSF